MFDHIMGATTEVLVDLWLVFGSCAHANIHVNPNPNQSESRSKTWIEHLLDSTNDLSAHKHKIRFEIKCNSNLKMHFLTN